MYTIPVVKIFTGIYILYKEVCIMQNCYNCKYQFMRSPCNRCRAERSPHYWDKRNVLDEIRIAIDRIWRNIKSGF